MRAAVTASETQGQLFGSTQAARIVGLPVSRLRQCIRHELIVPRRTAGGHYRFDFVDLLLLRTTRGLLEQRVPLTRIARVLRALRAQLGGRSLTQLAVSVDGERVVANDGAVCWQPESGQYLLSFAAAPGGERAAPVVTTLPTSSPNDLPNLSADEWCDLAMEIEATSPLEARAGYHHALDLEPDHLVARINLGRLLHTDGNLRGAEAHFREAIRSDPSCALGWYNLGVVLEDAGRPPEAIVAYEQAVHEAPDLSDAHWNLALLYERAGRADDALRHLQIYRRLTSRRS
jgi:DNA-binding transcriptional MerR regulator